MIIRFQGLSCGVPCFVLCFFSLSFPWKTFLILLGFVARVSATISTLYDHLSYTYLHLGKNYCFPEFKCLHCLFKDALELDQLISYLINKDDSKGLVLLGHSTGCQVSS